MVFKERVLIADKSKSREEHIMQIKFCSVYKIIMRKFKYKNVKHNEEKMQQNVGSQRS